MGIGRRVIDNPSTRSSKKKVEANPPICCTTLLTDESLIRSSRSGEPNLEAGAATLWRRNRFLGQELESFSRV